MKKILCMILTLSMLFTLVPCAAFAEEADNDLSKVRGTKDGNSYKNPGFGVQVSFPEDWMLLTDEQTAQLMGMGEEILDNENLAELLETNAGVYDLYAIASDNSGDNVNATLQKLNALQAALLTEEKLAAVNLEQLPEVMTGFGVTVTDIEQTVYSFAGAEHAGLRLTTEMQGVSMYHRIVFILKGNYYLTFSSFSLDPDRADKILGFFSQYDASADFLERAAASVAQPVADEAAGKDN